MTRNEFISNIIDSTPGVEGASFGLKAKDGVYTREESIKFYVSKKISLDELEEKDILPSTVMFNGKEYKTDVEEQKIVPLVSGVFPPGARRDKEVTVTVAEAYVNPNEFIVVSGLTSAEVDQINNGITMGWLGIHIELRYASTANYVESAVFDSGTSNTTLNFNGTASNGGALTLGATAEMFFVAENCDDNPGPTGCNFAPGVALQQAQHVQGGAQMSSAANPGFVGTFGCVAQDVDTDAYVGLTNAHVAAGIAEGKQYFSRVPATDPANIPDTAVGQNWSYGNNGVYGKVWRVHQNEITSSSSNANNTIDAAVVYINDGHLDALSLKQFKSEHVTTALTWADTDEIDDLMSRGDDIFAVGCRTGIKGADTDYVSNVKIKVTDMNVAIPIDLSDHGLPNATFNDCLAIRAYDDTTIEYSDGDTDWGTTCAGVSQGGDSGSAVIADIDGTMKIIGLLFAGGYTQHLGIVCRIDNVASLLRVRAWDGTTLDQPVDSAEETIVVKGNDTRQSITLPNGTTYYRVGLTSDPADTIA